MRVKKKSDKTDLKLNIQKMKIMAPNPITSWQIDREKMETVSDFIFFLILKSLQTVTSARKLRHLLLGRNVMTKLDNVLKSRNVTLLTKFHVVRAMIFQ